MSGPTLFVYTNNINTKRFIYQLRVVHELKIHQQMMRLYAMQAPLTGFIFFKEISALYSTPIQWISSNLECTLWDKFSVCSHIHVLT